MTYKGSFAPVTHFFGYQGRSGHPSTFDCSLASTMGFTAGILINNKLTGLCVSIKNLTQDPSVWRCGAVPILSLLEHYPKQGFKADDLIVKSDNVHHSSRAFQKMKSQNSRWRMEDRYTNPGPIQFYLDEKNENNKFAVTLDSMYS